MASHNDLGKLRRRISSWIFKSKNDYEIL